MDNKLISMTDFCLKKFEELPTQPTYIELMIYTRLIQNYANFLKQPLTLSMFVPVDEEWNVMEPVIKMDYETKYPPECYEYDLQKYKKAQEKVLFEGFFTQNGNQEVDKYTTYLINQENKCVVGYKKEWKDEWDFEGDAIEDLTPYGLTLIPSVLKQIQS